MTIERAQDQDQQLPPETPAQAHARVALEQSAMVSARLAIARWSNGSLGAHAPVYAFDAVSARGRWYDQVQNHFQHWLKRGGFTETAAVDATATAVGTAQLPTASDGSHADACID
ncbi:MAG: hypothetical protein ABIT83_16770 [Massilia sp.]